MAMSLTAPLTITVNLPDATAFIEAMKARHAGAVEAGLAAPEDSSIWMEVASGSFYVNIGPDLVSLQPGQRVQLRATHGTWQVWLVSK